MGGGFGPCLFTITSNRIIMATATSIAQEFRPLFIGGDPYTYASAGAAESITLPMSTSVFVLSNEGAELDGDLTVSLPDANHLGTEAILYLNAADADNTIVVNFTGLNNNSDSISAGGIAAVSGSFHIASLVWIGSAWVARSIPNFEPSLS